MPTVDDSTYDTVFQTVSKSTLILRVHLPTNASSSHLLPVMTLAGVTASHPWLDYHMKITGYKPMQSEAQWRDSRMLLGSAVQEVVQHFQVQPPTVQQIIDPGLRAIQPKGSPPVSGGGPPAHHPSLSSAAMEEDAPPPDYDETMWQSQSAPAPTPPPPPVDVPRVPAEFHRLESMDRDALEVLLDDHVALVSFCNDLGFIAELNEKLMSVLDENIERAKANLAREEELTALHAQVAEKQSKLKTLVQEFQTLEKKQASLSTVPDTRQLLKELHLAKDEAYEASEQVAEEWLDVGAPDVKAFCTRFIEARKVHHARAGKMELLQQRKPS